MEIKRFIICWLGKKGLSKQIPRLWVRGFPGGMVVENPPANAGDRGSRPGPGRSLRPQSN